MSFFRDLATGSDNCTPDGAGPSNAVGALVNTLLGSSSKTQEQLREVRAPSPSVPSPLAAAPCTVAGQHPSLSRPISRPLFPPTASPCAAGRHALRATKHHVSSQLPHRLPPVTASPSLPPPSAAPCAAAWRALGLHVAGSSGGGSGSPCGLLPGAGGRRSLTHGESRAPPWEGVPPPSKAEVAPCGVLLPSERSTVYGGFGPSHRLHAYPQ